MNVSEIINYLGTKIQGYAGYSTFENRQDTMDVFTAWIFGRLNKKIEDLGKHYKSWATLPDFGQIALVYSKMDRMLAIVLKHMKYDSKDIVPFLSEFVIHEEHVIADIVTLDQKAYNLEEDFCKLLDNLTTMQLSRMEESNSKIEQLLQVLRERTKRINALNKLFYVIQENVRVLCSKINSDNLDEKTMNGIFILIDKYPKRIETYEKVMEAFKNARPFYQNYNEQPNIAFTYAIYKLYLDKFPRLVERASEFISGYRPLCDRERKSLENLKKAVENPPDFEKLRLNLEELKNK